MAYRFSVILLTKTMAVFKTIIFGFLLGYIHEKIVSIWVMFRVFLCIFLDVSIEESIAACRCACFIII